MYLLAILVCFFAFLPSLYQTNAHDIGEAGVIGILTPIVFAMMTFLKNRIPSFHFPLANFIQAEKGVDKAGRRLRKTFLLYKFSITLSSFPN